MVEKKKEFLFEDMPRQCTKCGGKYVFQGCGRYTCENCGDEIYDDFGKIRAFLDEHGPSPAVVISEGTGVPILKITQFLRQGRMEIMDGSGEYIACENCGQPIRYGRYCPTCASKLTKNLSISLSSGEVGERPRYKATGQMYTQNLLRRGDK